MSNLTLRLAKNRTVQRTVLFGVTGLVVREVCTDDEHRKRPCLPGSLSSDKNMMLGLSTTTTCSCDAAAAADEGSHVAVRMSLEPRLNEKVAVITGASRGLGQAIAVKYVQEGARVVLLDVLDCNETLQKIAAIQNLKKSVDNVAMFIPCDISDEVQVKSAIQVAMSNAHFGPKIDILVNNACKFVFESVEDASAEDWMASMKVNILGHALVTKHCLPFMKHAASSSKSKGHGPSIIFQGSISSFRGQPNCATYATTKGAIVQLARNCAYDLAKYNIRVNSICAGTIETPISASERQEHGWTFEEWQSLKTHDVMLDRVGTCEEVANAALFFASDESSYCTGTHLMVDGGAAACTVMKK